MTEAWRRYTDAQREAQYNNRARVPQHPETIERWRRRSAEFRAAHPRARLDLECDGTEAEALDWFPAAGEQRAPVHVFIHGGYWQSLDKADFSFVAEAFNRAGIHCALLNYTLCPGADLDRIARQIGAALAWLWQQAETLGIDPERIQVGGHSAGAQLAALSLCLDRQALAAAVTPTPLPAPPAGFLHSVVAISGIYELQPLIGTSINAALGLTETMASRNSPLLRTPIDHAALLIVVGGEESEEFQRQAHALERCWSELSPRCEIRAGEDHFSIVEAFADADGELFTAARDLLLQ